MQRKYYYSEIFYSIQGEGHYTGVPTAWMRYFMCNLQCNGFGQTNPKDPSTHYLPYKDVDVSQYEKMTDLPVFKYGCDSSYSWAKKFKSLQYHETPDQIADKLVDVIRTPNNPKGEFTRPYHQPVHMCFTGGEPLMPHAQECTVEIIKSLRTNHHNILSNITFETNGTQTLKDDFIDVITNKGIFPGEIFFSMSPKLYSVSGEKPEKAIKPEVAALYADISKRGQLKFVVNNTKESWDEVEDVVANFRAVGVPYPVWIMNAGGTLEGQKGELEGHSTEAATANEALKRGYNYSSRVHVHIWGNTIGT